ncbi:MAG TPA: hypothetical protein EYG03_20740 [Planctomycetes bacterium]|nr:hypothetical protein [Fuerstiella sp.]HIK94378.1 hypothetical protein [Planctomycetota bacterium]
MSLRFRICLIAWITVVAVTACGQYASADSFLVTPDWTIEITPLQKVAPSVATPEVDAVPVAAASADGGTLQVNVADYVRIYKSIPFNRAEYNANPTYRHDSAMEILTGNARHQTIVRHGTPKQIPTQTQVTPYAGSGWPGISGYFPGTFIRPGVRLNYYRHFPSLNPYWSVGNPNGVF